MKRTIPPMATLAFAIATFALSTVSTAEDQGVTVYKSQTCGCCTKWVSHLKENGFEVNTIDLKDLRLIKSMSGVKPRQASCHMAKVGGYVIEGHVPAEDIRRLLEERPDVKGLTVPGMPSGSPGMEAPRQDPYEVLTLDEKGPGRVFARH